MHQYPFIFSNDRKYRILRHLAFWAFWWIFLGFLYSFIGFRDSENYWTYLTTSMLTSLVYLSAHMILAYALIYFVIPRYLLRQRYWQTAIWVIVLFILTAGFSSLLAATAVSDIHKAIIGRWYLDPERPLLTNIFLSLMAGLRGAITVGGIAAAIKLMKYWYGKEQRNLQLQKENVEAKLQLLQAQVHPHFLFNTLNNIYAHTQYSSPVAAKLVSGLSEMLRFMLQDGFEQQITLERELVLIREYIELEKIRYGNRLDMVIDMPSGVDDLYIAPLLLLPFVENSFKHGCSQFLEQPWISLRVLLLDSEMSMILVNGKNNLAEPRKDSTGTGIRNVRKRLELLYPGKHELSITEDEEVFIVNLKLRLTRLPAATSRLPGEVVYA